ncbi:ShlB/FhaC/HecB family hemolysin secretion/activation protein [Cupriavidus agavae]|uniref:Hemolysin activation/secretion protein n=1 Tax=Cupriavidus agavae TaxID=1001822 RepID=A0A4Q7S997_9BURK|nr:ShlB/FhaC/HecB family hemolysin secretion/activation protein [Cupriavidus agavae]RZT42933.1 hemolysin activation/secretion protein [Cupriavidus agavae]
MRHYLRRNSIWLGVVALLGMTPLAQAQTGGIVSPMRDQRMDLDNLERQREQSRVQQEIERERERQQQLGPAAPAPGAAAPAADTEARFLVNEIELLGDEDPAPEVETILAAYRGKPMGAHEIMAIVRDLTNHYMARGFVTTIVTVQPGSLNQGKLVLEVKWGTIKGMTINGQPPDGIRDHLRLFSALPFAADDVLDMGDIDQAVDNLMKAGSQDVIRIVPDVEAGKSTLDVVTAPPKRFNLGVGMNNSGRESEGWNQYSGSLGINNLTGLNDTLSTYYAQQDFKDSRNLQQIGSVSYSLPIGKWNFDASWYGSRYEKITGGVLGDYLSEGSSQRYNARLSRLLMRDADGKTSAYVKLGVKDNANSVAGFDLGVSSKMYSELGFGLSHVGKLGGGWVYGDLSLTAGVPWFGATWRDDPDMRHFDPDFVKVNGSLTWSRPFRIGSAEFQYEAGGGFQYSENRMVNDAQLSLGDEYTVRGFKDTAFYGDSGAWISNTLRMPLRANVLGGIELAPFVGYDVGFVNKNQPGARPEYLMGAAVGLRFSGKYFTSSLSYGWPLMSPGSTQTLAKAINYRLDLRY